MSYKKTLTCFSFTCSSQSEDVIKRCRHSNKILLPPNVLQDLITQDLFKENDILFFKVVKFYFFFVLHNYRPEKRASTNTFPKFVTTPDSLNDIRKFL